MKVIGYLLGLLLIGICYYTVDQPLAAWLAHQQFAQQWSWLWVLTALGSTKPYLVGLLLLALAARFIVPNKRWEQRFWFLWLCVLLPELICVGLKIGFGRARPELWFSQQLYGFYGLQLNPLFWSFPSGHTTTIMGFALGLSCVFPRYTVGFLVLAGLVVASRVMLLQHYLSDVLMATWLCCIEISVLSKRWRNT